MRLFAVVLTRRLSTWMDDNAILAPAQEGFLPHGGDFEQNYTLRILFNSARHSSVNSLPLGSTSPVHTAPSLMKPSLQVWKGSRPEENL